MLNKLLFITFILLGSLNANETFTQKMNYETSYQKALLKAIKQNKSLMLVMGTKTCPWCRKLERQTLQKDAIHSIVSENFVTLKLDRDTSTYPKQFKAKAVPTVYFINPTKQKAYHTVMGYKNKKDFKKILEKLTKDKR